MYGDGSLILDRIIPETQYRDHHMAVEKRFPYEGKRLGARITLSINWESEIECGLTLLSIKQQVCYNALVIKSVWHLS